MSEITQFLSQSAWMTGLWRVVVWAAAAYLFALGVLTFVRPAVVHGFFDGFVSSNRINLLEAGIRLIVGLAFMGVSAETKAPLVFFGFGAVLAATAIPMMFLYQFHKRQAAWAVPFAKRILPLMGAIAIAMAALIAWALS